MPSLAPPAAKPAEDPYTQYSTFLHPTFEADAFAHAVLNGEEYPAPSEEGSNGVPAGGSGFMKGLVGENGTGDVSAALARLNFGVEDLNRQLKAEVTKNHSSLLLQAASLGGLDGDLAEVRRGLAEVEGGVTRLKRKIAAPHDALASSLLLLTRLRRAASLARRAQRFTVLARRLEGQMSEIDESLLVAGEGVESAEDDPEALLPIRSLNAIEAAVPAVEMSRRRVVEEMETSVQRGLDEMDHPLLASSLQTAHNLSVLPALVENLVADLNDLVAGKVKACFDMASLAREIGGKEGPVNAASAFVYKSRTRNEPTQATMPQWAAAFWARLESLITDLGSICIKAYTLEKVLKLKKDQTTQASFLDEAMAVLDNKPSVLFWTSLAQAFETQAKEAARSSSFVQTTLSTGYPRLLRLFQEFFSRIAVHTDTVYTLAQQSPETVLILRAIQPFETLYLTRSTNRLTEAVSSAFSISSSLTSSFSSRPSAVPTANEGLTTARAIVNELDAARFDPLLAKAIAKGASRAVEAFVSRAEALAAHDHAATSLLGPLATPSQHRNADLTSALYHLWLPLDRALPDHTESVRETLRPAVNRIRSVYTAISNPLILAIRREFSALLARMHRVDYSKEVDSAHPPGPMSVGGTSSYMNDLTEKLALIKDEIFAAYRVGELIKEWTIELARFTVQTFLLHASLVHPIGESGKLKLTSDTTALEFAVNQYLAAQGLTLGNMGDQFKALRAFRPLLFLDLPSLADATKTSDVPTLILLHHLLSRANLPNALPLPYELHGWTEAEYVRWLNEHREEERMGMLRSVIQRWEEQKAKREEGDGAADERDDEAEKFVERIRQVLARTPR
ncbi:componentof oligomeric golgi complex 5 [Rhodotorula toruloides]|uniref:Conserved oligomeric Golgi complex subunit 5 n=1 Tax=Rhodotorula toruloides TaxID=5286 RepID=A0A511KIX8_RHOTO|nr:componentof oligomeric golgi complex 5 [Rhodotorula toruloides]